jgi:hypothetical protein
MQSTTKCNNCGNNVKGTRYIDDSPYGYIEVEHHYKCDCGWWIDWVYGYGFEGFSENEIYSLKPHGKKKVETHP